MLRLHNFSKLRQSLIWALFGIMGYANVSAQTYQGTVTISQVASNIQIAEGLNIRVIPASDIYAQKYGNQLYGDKIAINNGAIEVIKWKFSDYLFIVSGDTIPTIDSLQTRINAHNSGTIPTMKLYHVYRIVTAAPVPPDANTTYLIGDQDTILIADLDGDRDKFYCLKFLLVNPGANDLMTMQFNNVATASYDYRYAYAGSTSTQVANNASQIGVGSVQNGNTLTTLDLDIYAQTGVNRMIQWQQGITQASQATVGLPLIGNGVWKNNTTNMTSIRFGSATAGVIDYGVGSVVYVYRLN